MLQLGSIEIMVVVNTIDILPKYIGEKINKYEVLIGV